ncbi:hypothetical protein RJ640_013731, partial [Escallonia rubra]
ISTFSSMGMDGRALEMHNSGTTHQERAISTHAFSDLTHVSPLLFIYLLKECYVCGTCKATAKFRALQQQVHQMLYNSPRPGPAIFVVHCLYVLPIFESHCEGFSHLIISSLRRYLKTGTTKEDLLKAKLMAAHLFLDIVGGYVIHDERVLIKVLEAYDIRLTDIQKVMCNSDLTNHSGLVAAEAFVGRYILDLIESQSYMTAVSLLEHFSIRKSGESFLFKMMESKEYRAAEKWAAYMGKPMLCTLVQEYIDKQLLEHAYEIIKKNNLKEEFPEVYHKGKESSLKKLAEKGCWDVAETRTNNDKQLLEYLVYLAMEAGYFEKVDELCNRYSLKGFTNVKGMVALPFGLVIYVAFWMLEECDIMDCLLEILHYFVLYLEISVSKPDASLLHSNYLNFNKMDIEDIIWVDEVHGLLDATSYIEECKVVGIDCEWRPNYEKGSKPNKVSIMQIASEKRAYIFDLIKLFEDMPDILDNCLIRILHSPRILKLGYNFQCDVKQLALSYGDLKCFKQYEMLLDIQNVFKEPSGGLSGLAKKILGAGLNKTRRNSNWEQRPLTQNQLEYAALDAVVLIHIFSHVRDHSPPAGVSDGHSRIEWKSHIVSTNIENSINVLFTHPPPPQMHEHTSALANTYQSIDVSHMDNTKRTKRDCSSKKQCDGRTEEPSKLK